MPATMTSFNHAIRSNLSITVFMSLLKTLHLSKFLKCGCIFMKLFYYIVFEVLQILIIMLCIYIYNIYYILYIIYNLLLYISCCIMFF